MLIHGTRNDMILFRKDLFLNFVIRSWALEALRKIVA